ncbi:MAG: hypothetical protein H6975_07215 [Gammaproteobacteria bacterium]|nr:hypothetical protein [Gammaproteobacteria bacterium]
MKQIDEFQEFLAKFKDEDIVEQHGFSFKHPDTQDVIERLKNRISIPIPIDLENLLLTEGAFYHLYFADLWQTLQLYSAEELLNNRPLGLLEVIDYEWGGRPELQDWFTEDAASRLNNENIVFGYRYEDDNVHDYFFFNSLGCFDHLYFDQDSMESARLKLYTLSQGPGSRISLDELLKNQLDILIKTIEEENS